MNTCISSYINQYIYIYTRNRFLRYGKVTGPVCMTPCSVPCRSRNPTTQLDSTVTSPCLGSWPANITVEFWILLMEVDGNDDRFCWFLMKSWFKQRKKLWRKVESSCLIVLWWWRCLYFASWSFGCFALLCHKNLSEAGWFIICTASWQTWMIPNDRENVIAALHLHIVDRVTCLRRPIERSGFIKSHFRGMFPFNQWPSMTTNATKKVSHVHLHI